MGRTFRFDFKHDGRMRYIEVHDRGYHDEYFIVRDELPPSVKVTFFTIRQRFWERCRIYGEDGSLWQIEPVELPWSAFVIWLMAVTINSRSPIRMSYRRVGQYEFRNLRAKMQERVAAMIAEHGWKETDEVEDQLANALSFDDIVQALSGLKGRTAEWGWIQLLFPRATS